MSDNGKDAKTVQVSIESAIPQANLFARDQPAIQEGPQRAWEIGRTLIDFGGALLANGGRLRADKRIRDAVLLALLRRALITTESIYAALALGLEESAMVLSRTLLNIELNIKLVHRDDSDNMAKRLAAFHYYTYQQHGQDALSDRETREDMLEPASRVQEMVAVTRSYARLLESEVFDDVRDDVKNSPHWHGFKNTEDAFRSIDQASDFFITHDIGNWFVHDVNVDFDFVPSEGDEAFRIKPLAQRDPKVIQLHLAHALLRFNQILTVYVDERGIPDSPAFEAKTTLTFPDGRTEEVDSFQGVTALLLSQFSG